MRKTSILTFVAAFFFVVMVSANRVSIENPKTAISEQLKEILSQNSIDAEDEDTTARVLFKVNYEGEIELLRVSTSRKDIEWFLNRKLDGKKISVDDTSFGEVFVVDVRVTS
jgi:hypothetical protein